MSMTAVLFIQFRQIIFLICINDNPEVIDDVTKLAREFVYRYLCVKCNLILSFRAYVIMPTLKLLYDYHSASNGKSGRLFLRESLPQKQSLVSVFQLNHRSIFFEETVVPFAAAHQPLHSAEATSLYVAQEEDKFELFATISQDIQTFLLERRKDEVLINKQLIKKGLKT